MRRAGAIAFLASLMLVAASCGTQDAPQFSEAFGMIEGPCATGASPSTALRHCSAHVVITNTGGEGRGHLTIAEQIKDAKGAQATVVCGRSIPDLPNGAYADLTCDFDVPAGETASPIPLVQAIDFTTSVPSSTSSGIDLGGIATLIAAAATLLCAVAVFVIVARRPLVASSEATVPAPLPRAAMGPAGPVTPPAHKRDDPDAEYNLPQLPA